MRIIKIFLIVIPLLLLPILYLGSRSGSYLLPTALALLTFSFPVFRGRKLANISFVSMSLLSFCFVTFIAKDLLGLMGFMIPISVTWGMAIILTGLGYWWGQKPRLKKIQISIQGLPQNLHGLTMIQISDLHVGKNIGEKYVQGIVEEINDLKPDFIMFTGDIGDSEAELHAKELDGFKNAYAKHGMFYVPGNHEYYWNINQWLEVMKKLGMKVLLNENMVVEYQQEKILIAGITDPMDRRNPPDLNKAFGSEENKNVPLKILLSHRPDPGKMAGKLGFNLMLAGHTHGGQFFPWTLAVRLVHKFHAGFFHHQGLSIYVSGGTGSWGPLLRLGTTAEITYITLTS